MTCFIINYSDKHQARTIVAIRITRVVIEVEHTSIASVIVVASTFEPRVRAIHEVRIKEHQSNKSSRTRSHF